MVKSRDFMPPGNGVEARWCSQKPPYSSSEQGGGGGGGRNKRSYLSMT